MGIPNSSSSSRMGKTYRYQPPSKPAKLLVAENFEPRSFQYGKPQTVIVSANRGSNWQILEGSERERPLSAFTTNASTLRTKVEHDRQVYSTNGNYFVSPGQLDGARLARTEGSKRQGKRQGKPSTAPRDHDPKPASRSARKAAEQRELNLKNIDKLLEMEPSILVQRVGDKNTPTQKRKKNNSADRRRTLHKEAQNSMDLAMSTHTTAVY